MQNKGFTLIELIIIIAIMSILASICIPKNKIRDYQLHSQAKLLTNEIRMIRYKTMTEGGFDSIIINEENYLIVNGSEVTKNVQLEDKFHLSENFGRQIKFDLKGMPRSGGSITIKDRQTKRSHVITIVPYTGRVLLKE